MISTEELEGRMQRQRDFFATGATRDPHRRVAALRRLRDAIRRHEGQIHEALGKDLHKAAYEAHLTETAIVCHELESQIRHLRRWSRPERVRSPLFLFPSSSRIVKEPYGHVLVISPWNYPFQLSLAPLIAAVAAGNVVALKPSHKSRATAEVIRRILAEAFDPEWVDCYVGPTELSDRLLGQPFDYIFFTGSPRVGRIVMEAAARRLTPVTLELGGKSPCIVDAAADLRTAARRIVWGKLINAGQTCIAPDYLFVHNSVKDLLLEYMKSFITEFYGPDPRQSPDYPRIISSEAAERLSGLIAGENVYAGGEVDTEARYVAPTILVDVKPGDAVMQEEIFGPVLPVMAFEDIGEVVRFINGHPKPLALYYFGSRRDGKRLLGLTSSGGACINDTLLHVANPRLPFGGVGNSGMGSYHGRYGFETFTHRRSVLLSHTWIDFGIKFPPFGKLSTLKKFM